MYYQHPYPFTRTSVRLVAYRTGVRRTSVLYKFLNRTDVRFRSWPAARTHTALSRDFAAAYAAYATFPELPKTSNWLRPKMHTGSSKEFCLTGPHFCGIIKVSGFFCPAHVKKRSRTGRLPYGSIKKRYYASELSALLNKSDFVHLTINREAQLTLFVHNLNTILSDGRHGS